MIQAHIFYSGVVQGVGFRFTVQRAAERIGGLSGWVRNVEDGRVEILVEGPRAGIESLAMEVERRFDGSIRDRDIRFSPAEGGLTDFRIVL